MREGGVVFCDRCSRVLLVPGGRKDLGGWPAAVLTAGVDWCRVCVSRHGVPDLPAPPAASPAEVAPTATRTAPAASLMATGGVVPEASPARARPVAHPAPGGAPRPHPVFAMATTHEPPYRPGTVAEKYGAPRPAPVPARAVADRNRAAAAAYAARFGAPRVPAPRRGIVPASEILRAMSRSKVARRPLADAEVLLTTAEAAEHLDVTVNTLHKWKTRHGLAPAGRFHEGKACGYLYRVADVEDLAARASSSAAANHSAAARARLEDPSGPSATAHARAAATRAAQAVARLDELHRLLTAGVPMPEAVTAAGYSGGRKTARAAALHAGRHDLIPMLAVSRRAHTKTAHRIDELERLAASGSSHTDAWARAGWASRKSAERALLRQDRGDLAVWLRTGNRPTSRERAA